MARFVVMRWRALLKQALALILVGTLTGCSLPRVDDIRPEINKLDGLLVDAGLMTSLDELNKDGSVGNELDLSGGDVLGGEGVAGGGDPVSEPVEPVVVDDFVSAVDYVRYLQHYFASDLGISTTDVYFGIGFRGYSSGSDGQPATEYSYFGDVAWNASSYSVYGTQPTEAVIEYYKEYAPYKAEVSKVRSYCVSETLPKLMECHAADTDTTLEGTVSCSSHYDLYALISASKEKVGVFRARLTGSDVMGVLPRLKFNIVSTATEVRQCMLNPVEKETPFTQSMTVASIEAVLRGANYYHKMAQLESALTGIYSDSTSAALYYTDNFNRVFIVVGATSPDPTVDTMTLINEITARMSGMLYPTDVDALIEYLETNLPGFYGHSDPIVIVGE